jgi:hypothetical protein
MASIRQSIRSSTSSKRPTSAIADGQIALNTASGTPGLFFKDNANNIIKAGPAHYGASAPNSSPAAGGSAGNSIGEAWLDSSLTPAGWKIWNGAAWVNATPLSSDTVQGLVELATNAETQAGVDTARAVTSAGLQSKVSDSISTTSASGIASSTAVKTAYDLANAALPKSGGIITGNLEIGSTGSLTFEGSTADAFETALTVVNPTTDRTITLPDTTGTIITTGDTGTVTSTMLLDNTIVNADINASAAIAGTKISPNFGSQNITTSGNIAASGNITATSYIAPSGTAIAPSIQVGSGIAYVPGIYSPGADQVAVTTSGTPRLVVDGSGRVLLGTTSASGVAIFQVQTPAILPVSSDNAISFTNTATKTYPTTSGFTVGVGLEQNLEMGTAQIINAGFNFAEGFRNILTKSAGNTQDIERLNFRGIRNNFEWFDANTCKQYTSILDNFDYRGIDANGRTSSVFIADQIRFLPPSGGTQTMATIRTSTNCIIQATEGPGTVNITTGIGIQPSLQVSSTNSGSLTANISTHTFFGIGPSWGSVNNGTGVHSLTITNLYGLRLNAPLTSTNLTVTNNWGISQEWSIAKNWFAAASNQFPNITTTASSANVFVDSADSNRLYRSTSSSVYKKNVESLDAIAADKILDLRPVWYRSKCQNDRKDWSWYGLIAEEVAEIDPRFVHYGYQEDAYELISVTEVVPLEDSDPRREKGMETEKVITQKKQLKKDAKLVPNGIAYERLTVPLIDIAKRQKDQLAAQQELIDDLLARVSALEGNGAA